MLKGWKQIAYAVKLSHLSRIMGQKISVKTILRDIRGGKPEPPSNKLREEKPKSALLRWWRSRSSLSRHNSNSSRNSVADSQFGARNHHRRFNFGMS
jgi:hypothetical protein